MDVDMTPSKRREKSKSANDLKRLIRPISKVQLELDKRERRFTTSALFSSSFLIFTRAVAASSMSLSTVLDRNLFTPDPIPVDPDTSGSSSDLMSPQSPDRDSLTDSPFIVQPYPTRKQAVRSPAMDSPTQRHVEVVYDRFLMATSGVKRVGKGYQSSHVQPVSTGMPSSSSSSSSRSPGKFFHSTRRPMPPPVSSEDRFAAGSSVDELGRIQRGSVGAADASGFREDRAGAAKVVSRALKALTGKTVVKKASPTDC
jgi:serine/threonine-protein kinase GIN4